MTNLPILEMSADENAALFINKISLVGVPAVGVGFVAFSAENVAFSDDSRRELLGVALIPGQKVYRGPNAAMPDGFYMTFSAEGIRQVAQLYFKSGAATNIEHSDKEAGAVMFQSYIVDRENGLNPPANIKADIPDGSWIVGAKVNDDATWSDVKAGKFTGFSVEGLLKSTPLNFSDEAENLDEAVEMLEKFYNSL